MVSSGYSYVRASSYKGPVRLGFEITSICLLPKRPRFITLSLSLLSLSLSLSNLHVTSYVRAGILPIPYL